MSAASASAVAVRSAGLVEGNAARRCGLESYTIKRITRRFQPVLALHTTLKMPLRKHLLPQGTVVGESVCDLLSNSVTRHGAGLEGM